MSGADGHSPAGEKSYFSDLVLQRGRAATKMVSPCSLCVRKLNTENTEGLSGLCVLFFSRHRDHRGVARQRRIFLAQQDLVS